MYEKKRRKNIEYSYFISFFYMQKKKNTQKRGTKKHKFKIKSQHDQHSPSLPVSGRSMTDSPTTSTSGSTRFRRGTQYRAQCHSLWVVFGVQQAHNVVRPHPAIYIHLRDELCVGAIHDTEVTNHGLDGSS